ncbi:MAG: asparagine synthase (glutamine-hydrolyzing) [Deltaproteobacteria bacterium]
MCGITGLFCSNGVTKYLSNVIDSNNIIKYRGPDGEGIVLINTCNSQSESFFNESINPLSSNNIEANLAFGHRRLAILDLSSSGRQPMANKDHTIWLTFNGEIYNYLEIRDELICKGYSFISNADTEVIIYAYEEWGEKCVEHFNGMWAFALADLRKKLLFCSRDRFGIKPFYYYADGNHFAFGSEIKQLLQYPFIKSKCNERAVYEFLAYSAVEYCEETFFADIFKLEPGNNLILNFETIKKTNTQYYKPDLKINNDISYEDASSEFRRLLTDSVRLHLRSDVEVGSCLSGGLDSSSLVCIMHDMLEGEGKSNIQRTFSSHFQEKEANELKYMQSVIKHTGVNASFIEPTPEDFKKDIKKIVWHQDEPFGSTSIFAQWSVFKLVHEHGIKVMLDGQGADELLAGYVPLAYYYFNELNIKSKHAKLIWELLCYIRFHPEMNWINILPPSMNAFVSRFVKNKKNSPIVDWVNPQFENNIKEQAIFPKYSQIKNFDDKEVLNNVLYQLTFHTNIQSLLHYEDRNSMAYSVESRVPFLDYRLAEFVFTLPSNYKIRNGSTKSVMRTGMKGLIPENIRLRRSKLGFATPERTWQKTFLKSLMKEALENEKMKSFILPEKAFVYQDAIEKNSIQDPTFWRWINLYLWMEAYNVK